MLPNWLYGKSKSKLASILGGGGGTPADYNQVKAQVTQNAEDILSLSDALDSKAALTQITNPNLLDNSWFTVNQRAITTITNTAGYTVDRWRISQMGTITVNADNTITLEKASGESPQFLQYVEPELSKALDGKTVTLSAIVDGTFYSDTFVYENEDNFIKQIPLKDEWVLDYRCLGSSDNQHMIRFLTSGTSLASSVTIRAVKLELGSVSTLAMDTAPNYQQELAKCQRYFIGGQLESLYACKTSGKMNAFMLLPVTMRSTPVIVGTAGVYSLDDNSIVSGATLDSALGLYSNGVNIPISGANDTLCRVFIASGGGLSAEL